MMARKRKRFTNHEAQHVGEQIGIDWNNAPFDVEQFRMGWMSNWSTGSTIRSPM